MEQNIKLNMLTRFAYLETLLYWGDGLTTNNLTKTFGITRQSAQSILEAYRQQHPGQMRYDESLKRHVAEDNFTPNYIKGNAIDFLDYLRGQNLRAHYLSEPEWSNFAFTDVDRKLRPQLSRHIIQPILAALWNKKTVNIDYKITTEDDDDISIRIISPNHLFFIDNRYYLHAYCHMRDRHVNFELSRIWWVEPVDEEWVSAEHSRAWHEQVTLQFRPNQELPTKVQKTLLHSHQAHQGFLEIRCSLNDASYIRKKLLKEEFDGDRRFPLWIEIKRT